MIWISQLELRELMEMQFQAISAILQFAVICSNLDGFILIFRENWRKKLNKIAENWIKLEQIDENWLKLAEIG